MSSKIGLILTLILLFYFCPLRSQETAPVSKSVSAQATPPDSQSSNAALDSLVKQLEQRIKKLEQTKAEQQAANDLKKLMEEATTLSTLQKKQEAGVGKKFKSGVRQQSGLNPNISLGGDFFAAVSSVKDDFVSKPGEISYGTNRFELREIEVSLNAPLDPFTRGKTYISVTPDAIEIEEAYMEWLNLPASLNLKIGFFNLEFGMLNRYHDHALPQFDRPKVLAHFFTNAPVGGLGMAGNFLLPRLLFADATTFDVGVVRGGNNQSFTTEGYYNLLYSANFKNYYDLTRDTYLEWRVSGITGNNDPAENYRSYVGNLSLAIKWAPVGRAKYRTIDWRTEFLFSRRETAAGKIESKGFYTSLQNKLDARHWLTGRVGYAELPFDHNQHEWDFTLCGDYWQSEFVFWRLQYQYSMREFTDYPNIAGPYPNSHTVLFQVCWAMGPHKHEAY